MTNTLKRLLSMLMVVMMVISMLPTTVFAAGTDTDGYTLVANETELTEAITAGGNIRLQNNIELTMEPDEYHNAFTLNKNITLDFNGHEISSAKEMRLFELAAKITVKLYSSAVDAEGNKIRGSVRMPGYDLKGSSLETDDTGSIICMARNAEATLDVDDVNITKSAVNANATGSGGIVQVRYKNTATFDNCDLTWDESITSGAVANGGILYVSSSGATATLTNCRLAGGRVTGNGGLIHTTATNTVTLNNCVLENGYATKYGGNISMNQGTFTVTNCTISNGYAGTNGANIWVNSKNSAKLNVIGTVVNAKSASCTKANIFKGAAGVINLYSGRLYGKIYVTSAEVEYSTLQQACTEITQDGDYYVIQHDCSNLTNGKCATCKKTYSGEWLKHTITESSTAGTCVDVVTTTYTCDYCDYERVVTGDKGDHSWDGGITENATCMEAGSTTYTCTLCSETKTEEIPALGHELGTDGNCSNCGELIVAVVGENEYHTTLADAIEAGIEAGEENSKTVKLLQDIILYADDAEEELYGNKTAFVLSGANALTLDLNGKKISSEDTMRLFKLVNGFTLKLNSSAAEKGRIEMDGVEKSTDNHDGGGIIQLNTSDAKSFFYATNIVFVKTAQTYQPVKDENGDADHIFGISGGILQVRGANEATLTDCEFRWAEGLTGWAGGGGCISAANNGAVLTITDCILDGGRALTGGNLAASASSKVDITRGSIINGEATRTDGLDGGNIYKQGTSLTAGYIKMTGTTVSGGTAGRYDNIQVTGGKFYMTNCQVTDTGKFDVSSSNGALYIYSGTYHSDPTEYVVGCATINEENGVWTVTKGADTHTALVAHDATPATCTEDGNEAYWECETCGGIFSDAEGTTRIAAPVAIPALDHDFTILEGKAATCTETGLTEGKDCSRCDAEDVAQVEIPALDHDFTTLEGKAATCTETGLTEGKDCSRCDAEDVAQEEIPALDHDFTILEGKAATCTETGLTDGKDCSRCDAEDVAQVEIPVLGHTWVNYEAVKPTCINEGNVAYQRCSVCGAAQTWEEEPKPLSQYGWILAATDEHTLEHHEAIEATCTENGHEAFDYCTTCECFFYADPLKLTYQAGVILAPGHNEVIDEAVAATCTDTGLTEGKHCDVCSEVLIAQTVVAALGHTEEIIPGKDATCAELGKTEGKECSVCGEVLVKQENIPFKEHDCTYTSDNAGNHTVGCTNCDHSASEACDTNGTDGACSKCGYVAATYIAQVGETKYEDLQAAINAAANGGTVVLLDDLTIESDLNNAGKGLYNIADGQNVTIDLNGKTIDVTDNSTGNFILFYSYGELTVKNGTINLTATNDRNWNAQSTIILNRGGILNVESGNYTHNGGTDMAFVLDNSGNWYGDATTNISGGTLTSSYIAIRNRMEQNSHGASGKATLNVTAGTINGTSRAIWAQAASVSETAPATGAINVSGGDIGLIDTPRSTGAVSMTTISGGNVAAFMGEVGELTVTDSDALGEVTMMTTAGEVTEHVVSDSGLYVQAVAKIIRGKVENTGSSEISFSNVTGAAKYQEINFATLEEALAAIQAGDELVLLADATISQKINVTGDLTIDGNGHTLTYTGQDRAINVATSDVDLTVKNLTIDCTAGYCQRGISYGSNGNLTLEGVTVKGTNVTYAVNLPGSSDNAVVTITDSDISGAIALNVWGENSVINVTDTALTSVDKATAENYAAIRLNNDGTTAANGAVVNVTGGSITALDEKGEPSTAYSNSTTGAVNISDTTVVTGYVEEYVAVVTYAGYSDFYGCNTLQDAINVASDDPTATVKLLKDIELTESIKITGTVVVDLNGKKLTGPDVPATKSYYAFIVDGGDLTLKDSVGTGELWAKCYGVETKSGSFTMESGTITATNNATLGSAVVNYGGNVTIKGGTLSGSLAAVHTAGYFSDAATSIQGGTINGKVAVEDYADKSFTETVSSNSNELAIADGYKWVEQDGVYVLTKKAPKAHFESGAYANYAANKPREHVGINVWDIYAEESLVVKTYANGTLIATTTYREYDLEDVEQTSKRYPVETSKQLTVNIVVSGKEAGSWDTVWHVAPSVAYIPDTFEVYADGVLTDTWTEGFSSETEVNDYIAFVGVYKAASITDGEGNVSYFATLQDAVNAANAGETVTVLNDIVLTETLTIAADDEIILDLNGKTVSQVKEQTAAYSMINNKGALTITDSSAEQTGKISYTDSGIGGEYVSNTISNSGKLTVEAGTIENLSSATVAQNGYPQVIDNSGALTVKGGTINCASYAAIRIWCTTDDDTIVTIEGGNITGSIDLHNVNGNANKGTLNITGGTITQNGFTTKVVRVVNFGSDIDELAINIEGGNIDGVLGVSGSVKDVDMSVVYNVSGGTFTSAVPAAYCAEGYVPADNGDGTYGVTEKVELPEVEITDIKDSLTADDPELTYALKFAIKDAENLSDEYLEKLFEQYGSHYVDYVLTIEGLSDENVTFNADGNVDGYLAGRYAAWNENAWVSVPFENVTVANGESLYIMEYAAKLMNKQGLRFTLKEVAEIVQNFDCGIYFTDEFLRANPNMKVTLQLKVFTEDANGTKIEDMNVATKVFYAPVLLPEVVITDIKDSLKDSDPDLTFALNFAIKDVESMLEDEEYLEKLFNQYGSHYVDYVLTISGLSDADATFNANGTADGYLAGQYDAWSENWVSVPFEDVTIKNGESLYIMEYAAKLMGKQGLRYTLAEVAEIVQNFDCGIYFTPEFLEANPNMKVTLELKVFTEDAEGNKIEDISVATKTFPKESIVAIIENEGKQTKYFATLQAAVNAANAGDTIQLLTNITLTEAVLVDKSVTLNLNGKTITTATQPADTYVDAFTIMANVTVTGEGIVDARPSNGYTFYIGDKSDNAGSLTIEDGTFYGETSVAQVTTGSLNVKGGYFEIALEKETDDYRYLLNCWDNNYKTGEAKISVTGGTFKNFDPDSNLAEGTDTDFCADGYIGVTNADGLYEVLKMPNAIVTEQDKLTLKAGEYNIWTGSLTTGDVDRPLEVVVNFEAKDTLEECLAGGFSKWLVDFYLTVDGLESDTFVADNSYLAGNYGSFGWIAIPTDGLELEEGVTYPVVSGYDATLNYKDICNSVKNFTAAIHVDQAILNANPNIEVKLALKMTNPNNPEEVILIGEEMIYDFYDLSAGVAQNTTTGSIYATLQDAVNAANDGETIQLLADIALTETVVNTKKVTLDLNGKTIAGTDNNTSGNFYLINNSKGDLTIDDSVGGGKITLTAANERNWSSSSVVVANNLGTVTVKGGEIAHLGGTSMAYGIDNLTNGANTVATLNVEGGKIDSTYFAIRQFANNGTNNLSVIGGEIGYIWMQSPNNNVNVASTVVEDGAKVAGVCLTGKNADVTLKVADTALTTESKVYGTMPTGKILVNDNGIWTLADPVAKVVDAEGNEEIFATLQEAVNAANDGETVTLLASVELTEAVLVDKSVTLNLNGKTITTATQDAGTYVDAFTIMADVTVTGNGTVDARPSNGYTFYIGDKSDNAGSLTIEDGTFYGETSVAQVTTGSLTVEGGYFEIDLEKETDDYRYLLNCWDNNYKTGDAKISVTGGTFKNFDPEANAAEGEDTNFCADGYVSVDNGDGTYSVTEKVELPEVVITDIKSTLTDSDPDLTFALNFAIKDVENMLKDEEYLKKLFQQYGSHYVDYVLTIKGLTDENVTFNSNGTADGYLAGQYDAWSKNWVSVPFEDVTIKNGESLYIMEYAAKLMGKQGLRYTLAEVAEIVQNFDCGIYFTPEFLNANPNLEVTLELKVFTEDAEGNKIEDISVATEQFPKKNIVAVVVDENKQSHYFDNLADAIAAAEAGETVIMLEDVAASEIITIDKAITLDGFGHKLTSTAGRAINVNCADAVAIKNLTVVNGGNCERAINVIQKAAKLTLEGVKAEGFKYTVNVASSSVGSNIAIKNSELSGYAAVNIGGNNTTVTVENSKLTGVNDVPNHETNAFGVIAVGTDGLENIEVTVDANSTLTATSTNGNRQFIVAANDAKNSTFYVAGTLNLVNNDVFNGYPEDVTATFQGQYSDEIVAQGYAYVKNEDGTVTVTDAEDYVAMNVQTDTFYTTLESALAEAKNGETVIMLTDIEAEGDITVRRGTLDLNGYKLTIGADYFLMASFNDTFVIDGSAENTGLLVADASQLILLENNAQLPIETAEGIRFVEVKMGNNWATSKGLYQFWINSADAMLIEELSKDDCNVTFEIELNWDGGNQTFCYGRELVELYLQGWTTKALELKIVAGVDSVTNLTYTGRIVFAAGTTAEVVIEVPVPVQHGVRQ